MRIKVFKQNIENLWINFQSKKMTPSFLTLNDIIEIHEMEIEISGGKPGIRDLHLLESAIGSVEATFDGKYLYSIFEMAATYIHAICFNHPFFDGNKRTGLASGLTFLYINGYELDEDYDEEFADLVLNLVTKKIDKHFLSEFLEKRSLT